MKKTLDLELLKTCGNNLQEIKNLLQSAPAFEDPEEIYRYLCALLSEGVAENLLLRLNRSELLLAFSVERLMYFGLYEQLAQKGSLDALEILAENGKFELLVKYPTEKSCKLLHHNGRYYDLIRLGRLDLLSYEALYQLVDFGCWERVYQLLEMGRCSQRRKIVFLLTQHRQFAYLARHRNHLQLLRERQWHWLWRSFCPQPLGA